MIMNKTEEECKEKYKNFNEKELRIIIDSVDYSRFLHESSPLSKPWEAHRMIIYEIGRELRIRESYE